MVCLGSGGSRSEASAGIENIELVSCRDDGFSRVQVDQSEAELVGSQLSDGGWNGMDDPLYCS